jgi:hypothetical protein
MEPSRNPPNVLEYSGLLGTHGQGNFSLYRPVAEPYHLYEAIDIAKPHDPHVLLEMGERARTFGLTHLILAKAEDTPENMALRKNALVSLLATTPYPLGYEQFENDLARAIACKLAGPLSRTLLCAFNIASICADRNHILKYVRHIADVQTRIMRDEFGFDFVTPPADVAPFTLSRAIYEAHNKGLAGEVFPAALYLPETHHNVAYIETKAKKEVVAINMHPDAKALGRPDILRQYGIHEILHHHFKNAVDNMVAKVKEHPDKNFELATPFERAAYLVKMQQIGTMGIQTSIGGIGYRSAIEERMCYSLMIKVNALMQHQPVPSEREIFSSYLKNKLPQDGWHALETNLAYLDRERAGILRAHGYATEPKKPLPLYNTAHWARDLYFV